MEIRNFLRFKEGGLTTGKNQSGGYELFKSGKKKCDCEVFGMVYETTNRFRVQAQNT